jgi:large conductance mechanosensitive channel
MQRLVPAPDGHTRGPAWRLRQPPSRVARNSLKSLAIVRESHPNWQAQQTGGEPGEESMLKEFRDFAMRGNVIDLAVGIIIGAAFTTVVNSLVKDIIMPPIGYIMNGIDFSNFFLVLKGDEYPSLKAAQDAGAVTINYGVFINACINFLIVAFAVFLLVKQVNRFRKQAPAEPPAPTTSEKLLMEIRDALKAAR